MELLLDNNHTIIEDLYNIISIHKVKNNPKSKFPDELYKTLKSAKKLEKEIENTTKITINEAENDNFNSFNFKQLESICDSIKLNNKYTTKYYNIKQVQVLLTLE